MALVKAFPIPFERLFTTTFPGQDIFIQDWDTSMKLPPARNKKNSNCQEQATVAPGGELGNKSTKMQQGLTLVLENVGVCSPNRNKANVRRFVLNLIAMVDWLSECGVDTVTMEATGVYWIPVFQILESRGKSNW